MPTSHRSEWEQLLTIENAREKRTRMEESLDRGIGECHLREAESGQLTEDALLHFHDDRSDLLAWCVMPNHVPDLVHVWRTPLWKLVQSWKRFVATRASLTLAERRTPVRHFSAIKIITPNWSSALQSTFWEREHWDTFMRDEEQERTAVRYVENNPVTAKLCRAPEDWPFSSGRLRDTIRRLTVPAQHAKCTRC